MNRSILIKLILLVITISLTQSIANFSYAVEPDEILKNPKYELRARNISKNIRCMVCQNQSIDESNAPLAKDLRILIREQIKKGYEDKEIYKFLTDRYGDFILLKPAFSSKNIILWFLPFIFLMLGVYFVFYHNKKSQ